MSGLSVLTLARGRTAHLRNLVEGLRRSEQIPHELVVVDMNDEPVSLDAADFPIRLVRMPESRLPLAAARNLAAKLSTGARLLFLDADCIPSRGLFGAVDRVLENHDGLVCPEVFYLGPDDARGDWTERELLAGGRPHEARQFPESGVRAERNAGLFWSLAFGVRRETFEALGGFDESFVGYGGEDTDLGFQAQKTGVPLLFMGGERAFHQHHLVSDPPFEHLADIVRNAAVFREKWGRWPMEGWLAAFERAGAIRLGEGVIEIVDAAA